MRAAWGAPAAAGRLLGALGLSLLGCTALGCNRDSKGPGPGGDRTEAVVSAAPAPSASNAGAAPERLSRPDRKLNVLLLTIDAWRRDHASWHGYQRNPTPNLARLVEQAVTYDDYRSLASYTAQSVSVMLSGRYTSTLYRTGVFFTGYPASNLFFSEVLQQRGVKTAGVHSHLYFARGKGLDQGFDVWRMTPGITFDSETDNNVTTPKSFEEIRSILSDAAFTRGQFFLWSHLTDPHDQYVRHELCPEEWGKQNTDRYDCELYFVDHHLGQFLAWAKQQSWWERTALVVSSDHGEAFGDHGMWKHAFRLWEPLVRIPTLFVVPGASPRRIEARRSHLDLAPTILDLMGVAVPESMMGKSMVPEIFGAKPDNREPIILELNEDSHNPPVRALILGDYKLMVEGESWRFALYNLAQDPGEQKDLSTEQPEKLAEMKEHFQRAYEKIPRVRPYGGMKLKGGRTANGPSGPPRAP